MTRNEFYFARGHMLREAVETVLDVMESIPDTAPSNMPPQELEEAVVQPLSEVVLGDGVGPHQALKLVLGAAARGAVNPASPRCTAHLQCAPSSIAAAADLGVSILNQSMDSWDQAPAASAIELLTARHLSRILYPDHTTAETLFTGGATESTLVSLLLAREKADQTPTLVVGSNAHHSIRRAAWILGFRDVFTVQAESGRIHGALVANALEKIDGPVVISATAGTTDHGIIDDIGGIADVAEKRDAWLHLDAAYGGALLFSDTHRDQLAGHAKYDSIALDLHKLGWQPVCSGILSLANADDGAPLHLTANYLNADDDIEHGIPDMLGRSLRTSRRADAVRIYTCLAAMGIEGLGELVDRCVDAAKTLHRVLQADNRFEIGTPEPGITTVVFRPKTVPGLSPDELSVHVAALRRNLTEQGSVVLGRSFSPESTAEDCWLKATVLNPLMTRNEIDELLDTIDAEWCDQIGRYNEKL